MAMSQRKKKNQLSKKERQRANIPRPFHSKNLPDDVKVIPTPTGEARMSEVISEFIEPFEWADLEDLKKLVSIAIIAWNLAISPADRREELLREIALSIPPDLQQVMREHFEALIQRKLQYFADNTRFILDYQVTMTEDGPHVSVMSTLPEPKPLRDG
jgi:hypothetical protein